MEKQIIKYKVIVDKPRLEDGALSSVFKKGDIVGINTQPLKSGYLYCESNCCWYNKNDFIILDNGNVEDVEAQKMELKDISKESIKEAKKQFQEDKTSAEIREAKLLLSLYKDRSDEIAREIRRLEQQKKDLDEKYKDLL